MQITPRSLAISIIVASLFILVFASGQQSFRYIVANAFAAQTLTAFPYETFEALQQQQMETIIPLVATATAVQMARSHVQSEYQNTKVALSAELQVMALSAIGPTGRKQVLDVLTDLNTNASYVGTENFQSSDTILPDWEKTSAAPPLVSQGMWLFHNPTVALRYSLTDPWRAMAFDIHYAEFLDEAICNGRSQLQFNDLEYVTLHFDTNRLWLTLAQSKQGQVVETHLENVSVTDPCQEIRALLIEEGNLLLFLTQDRILAVFHLEQMAEYLEIRLISDLAIKSLAVRELK